MMGTLNPDRELVMESVLVADIGKGDTVVAYHVNTQTNREYVVVTQPVIDTASRCYVFGVSTPEGLPHGTWEVPPHMMVNVLR